VLGAVLYQPLLDVLLVPVECLFFYLSCDFRVFGEDLAQEELLGERERFHLGDGLDNEFTLSVVAHVVVTEEGVFFVINSNLDCFFGEYLREQIITNSNSSNGDEIHLTDLVFFVVDQRHIVLWREFPWNQPERNIIQELALLVLRSVEEESESRENVLEEVHYHDVSLD